VPSVIHHGREDIPYRAGYSCRPSDADASRNSMIRKKPNENLRKNRWKSNG